MAIRPPSFKGERNGTSNSRDDVKDRGAWRGEIYLAKADAERLERLRELLGGGISRAKTLAIGLRMALDAQENGGIDERFKKDEPSG